MASAGVVVARAQLSIAGIDRVTPARIVVAGEGAQTTSLLRGKQIDALSPFDTLYALVENAGQKPRQLPLGDMAPYPGNGFFALEKTLKDRREDAIRILKTKPIGKDEETALRDDRKVPRARMAHSDLASRGVTSGAKATWQTTTTTSTSW